MKILKFLLIGQRKEIQYLKTARFLIWSLKSKHRTKWQLIDGGDLKKKYIKLSYDEKELNCVASSQSSYNTIKKKYFYWGFTENKTTEFRSFNDMMEYCQRFRVIELNHQNWKTSKYNCVERKKNKFLIL